MQLPPNDAYALSRALSGLPYDDLPTSPITQLLLTNLDLNSTDGMRLARQLLGPEGIQQVLAVDPNAPPPHQEQTQPVAGDLQIPPLPQAARLSDAAIAQAASVGGWLDDYMAWATRRSPMTPQLFMEGGGLWAIGLIIARRLFVQLSFDRIYPHLYALWIAPTSHFKKTTGLNAVVQLVRDILPHMLLAPQTTPEMLLFKLAGQATPNYDRLSAYDKAIEDLGRQFAAQRGITAGEATKLFINKKYMEGMPELYMELYDGPDIIEREIKSDGKQIIRQAAFSLLGATTPARLSRTLAGGEWEDGLLARFALLTPRESFIARVTTTADDSGFDPPPELKRRLMKLYQLLPDPPQPNQFMTDDAPPSLDALSFAIDPDALDQFNAYADAMHMMTAPDSGLDERLRGNYSRFPIQAVKVAICLAAVDWADREAEPGSRIIQAAHFARAQLIVESWRESAHRLLVDLNRGEDIKDEERVLAYLHRSDRPHTAREIFRNTGISERKRVDAAIASLVRSGDVVEFQITGRNGQLKTVYSVDAQEQSQ